jgi:FkbM family methyltransferase
MKRVCVKTRFNAGVSGPGPGKEVPHAGHTGSNRFAELIERTVRVKIVDVGANPIDEEPPYAAMLANNDANAVGFEPNPEAFKKLQGMSVPNAVYLPLAVGDGTTRTLHVCYAPGMTSLLEPNPEVLGLMLRAPLWGRVMSTKEVETVRLADIKAAHDADYLKMDIQGAELMALENAGIVLDAVNVIQVEVEFLPLYKNQPLFSDIDVYLRSRGFQFHRFIRLISRVMQPLALNMDAFSEMSQIVWGDAIFIRSFPQMTALPDRKLINMAAVMNDCYRSADIAAHALSILDQRHGSQLVNTFLTNSHATQKVSKDGQAA